MRILIAEDAPVSRLALEAILGKSDYEVIAACDGTEAWAAIPQTRVEVGAKVQIAESLVMTKFTSPSLSRTFDSIIFGTLIGDKQPRDGGVNKAGKDKPGKDKPKPELPPGHPPIDK